MADVIVFEAVIGAQAEEVVRLPLKAEKPYTVEELINLAHSYADEKGLSFTAVGVRQYKNGHFIRPSFIGGDMVNFEMSRDSDGRRQDASFS